jgi:hypothetical protein
MTNYTLEGLSAIVRMDAGWARESKETRAWMVATAMCESSGDPRASNSVGGGHYGLWQISKSNWGYLFAQYQWDNPRDNAAMALAVYKKQGRGAWTASAVCAAARYPAARKLEDQPVAAPSGVNTSDIPGPTKPLTPSLAFPPGYEGLEPGVTSIVKGLSFLTDPHNWQRTAMFVGGGALLLVGVVGVLGKSGAGRQLVNAVPAGRAIKAVT